MQAASARHDGGTFLAAQHPVIEMRRDADHIDRLAQQIVDQPFEEELLLLRLIALPCRHHPVFFQQRRCNFKLVKFAALFGWDMKVGLNYYDTAFAMIAVSVWKQIPYNFIFILSGLQSIPASVREAAAIDCRSGFRRFWTMTLPLLAPTAFFLLIINMTYALFDTFGVIDVMVKDKAANNPITLVYKVYMDGFRGNDLGGSSAQSVILMIVVFVLTIFQFRFIERRVHYN